VLKQAGIVLDDKRGNQVFYRLRVPCTFFNASESNSRRENQRKSLPISSADKSFPCERTLPSTAGPGVFITPK
jgi:hypothetical protein